MAKTAVAKVNHENPLGDIVQPEHDGFYCFLENWQSRNSTQESASGFAHVRLVVAPVQGWERRGNHGAWL